ncbi:MAG TPA: VOC family protein [Kiloniellales bacterium]|nr:VOC family protein [Kiloniellales bacterium]
MRLYGIRIFVDDLEAARHFYERDLGLPVKWTHAKIAVGYDLGVDLIVEEVDAEAEENDQALVGRFVGASIAVDDIDSVYETLTAKGVAFVGPPERQAWGGKLAHFEDPSGNVLTLLGA